MPSFRGSSQPRDQIRPPTLQVDSLPFEPPRKPDIKGGYAWWGQRRYRKCLYCPVNLAVNVKLVLKTVFKNHENGIKYYEKRSNRIQNFFL